MSAPSQATRQPLPVAALSIGVVLIWLFLAAFPFLWTAWGSFKVEGDFFSRANWLNAIYGPATIAQTGDAFTGDGSAALAAALPAGGRKGSSTPGASPLSATAVA